MAKRKRPAQPEARRPKNLPAGRRARSGHGDSQETLISLHIGALPIINRLIERMRLHEFLTRHLPPEDNRTKLPTPTVVLVLLKNLLVSRQPMYGVAEWASNYAPWLLGLQQESLKHLHDDRVGRCLDCIFAALDSNLILDIVRHVVGEFGVRLDELHNDSTTITFFGDHADAARGQRRLGRTTPAITWGHNKDHRPDLKQLLYILTVSDDGGIPVYFQAASGNTTDDQTHQATWQVLSELVGRVDFVYVADCKLATMENMTHIAGRGGRFVTVLPATRKENAEFRQRLADKPQTIPWRDVYHLTDEDGELLDAFRVCLDEHVSQEGFRLLWFHSRRKEETDAATRARQLQRAIGELTDLRERLQGSRTRFRQHEKVVAAVDAILDARGAREFLRVEITQQEQETFRQTKRGRPSPTTQYKREVTTRFDVSWEIDARQLDRAARGDGVFPLITNVRDWDAAEVLQAYKRQPVIEKRFSQLKTDFRVAPVYLQSVTRIVGLLAVYFLALMVQSLLERELRNAMGSAAVESLPLYPEGRSCVRPTSRQVLDLFEPLSVHKLMRAGKPPRFFHSELAPLHRQLLKLLRIPATAYDL